jgi:hypothetical protein
MATHKFACNSYACTSSLVHVGAPAAESALGLKKGNQQEDIEAPVAKRWVHNCHKKQRYGDDVWVNDRTLVVVALSETPSQENSCSKFEQNAKKEGSNADSIKKSLRNQLESCGLLTQAGIEVLREKIAMKRMNSIIEDHTQPHVQHSNK